MPLKHGPIDLIFDYIMGQQVIEDLKAVGFGISPIQPGTDANYYIEFILQWVWQRKKLAPLLYRITLESDKAVLTVLDGIPDRNFPYCDPKFPDNLLRYLTDLRDHARTTAD